MGSRGGGAAGPGAVRLRHGEAQCICGPTGLLGTGSKWRRWCCCPGQVQHDYDMVSFLLHVFECTTAQAAKVSEDGATGSAVEEVVLQARRRVSHKSVAWSLKNSSQTLHAAARCTPAHQTFHPHHLPAGRRPVLREEGAIPALPQRKAGHGRACGAPHERLVMRQLAGGQTPWQSRRRPAASPGVAVVWSCAFAMDVSGSDLAFASFTPLPRPAQSSWNTKSCRRVHATLSSTSNTHPVGLYVRHAWVRHTSCSLPPVCGCTVPLRCPNGSSSLTSQPKWMEQQSACGLTPGF